MTRIVPCLLTLCALAAGTAAQAQSYPTPVRPGVGMNNGGMGTGDVTNRKQAELAKISQRMQILQTLQSCVNGAQTGDAIKQCNETARASQGHHEKRC